MSIDFNKPLECEHGFVVMEGLTGAEFNIGFRGEPGKGYIRYNVLADGRPSISHLPDSFTVRNVKSVEDKAKELLGAYFIEDTAFSACKIVRVLKEANLLAGDK